VPLDPRCRPRDRCRASPRLVRPAHARRDGGPFRPAADDRRRAADCRAARRAYLGGRHHPARPGARPCWRADPGRCRLAVEALSRRPGPRRGGGDGEPRPGRLRGGIHRRVHPHRQGGRAAPGCRGSRRAPGDRL
ncbi:MAG: hypothetical protein AVDCRST_MAG27-1109, partial [uncultured Craurococcus sp.]